MTPKEKAKEIYDGMKGFRVKNTHRKKCALFCIYEMLNMVDNDYFDFNRKYLEDVKEELEQL